VLKREKRAKAKIKVLKSVITSYEYKMDDSCSRESELKKELNIQYSHNAKLEEDYLKLQNMIPKTQLDYNGIYVNFQINFWREFNVLFNFY